MSPTSRSKRRRGRKRGGSSSMRSRGPMPSCEVCKEPIYDMLIAIAKPDSNSPIHFECALNIVRKELNSGEDEKIIYLGNGSFAVVNLEDYQHKRLAIRRQINWEDVEKRDDWRMELRTDIN